MSTAHERQREAMIASALESGKLVPTSDLDRYRRSYDRDPAATQRLIDELVAVPEMGTSAAQPSEQQLSAARRAMGLKHG